MQSELLRQIAAIDLQSRPWAEVKKLSIRLARNWGEMEHLSPVRVAILGSFTTDYLSDPLRLMLYRRGISAEVHRSGYGQLVSEVLSNGPALSAEPDIVLVLLNYRDLRHIPQLGASAEQAHEAAKREASFWSELVARIAKPTVVLTFDQPQTRQLDELDGLFPGGRGLHARLTNMYMAEQLPKAVSLIDGEALQARLGTLWHAPRVYALCKQPFAMEAIPEVVDTIASALTARLGKSKKVLVLDLDNTLWGGVVGDVGIDNLELGFETPEGEPFVAFQSYVKDLARRGVILAICSKNDHEIAMEAIRSHPAMVLAEGDFATTAINFEDKATNLRRISRTLNLGLDSIVFVDDNPVEREWVHRDVPEVTVVDLPEDPSQYVEALQRAKLFPLQSITAEDLARGASYKAIAAAAGVLETAANMDAFLQDLAPVTTIEAVDDGSTDRVVQLVAKTNQFKLNSHLFDHNALRSGKYEVVALRMQDRLQDYGIVAVAVAAIERERLDVCNWVMSCRVFGRRLEHAMLQILCSIAEAKGMDKITLLYEPSAKNAPALNAIKGFGFSKGSAEGQYVLPLSERGHFKDHYMTIIDKRR